MPCSEWLVAQSAKADAAARQAELAALEENEEMVGPEPLPLEQRGGITEFDRGALRPGGPLGADCSGQSCVAGMTHKLQAMGTMLPTSVQPLFRR